MTTFRSIGLAFEALYNLIKQEALLYGQIMADPPLFETLSVSEILTNEDVAASSLR